MSLLLYVLAGIVVQGIVRALVWSQPAPEPTDRLVDGAE